MKKIVVIVVASLLVLSMTVGLVVYGILSKKRVGRTKSKRKIRPKK